MANKVTAKESKVTTKKAAPAKVSKTKAAASKINKGDAYLCEICGLQVNVDVCGEYLETTGLYCCGKAMKEKTGKAKVKK